jgi:hypothetical protein
MSHSEEAWNIRRIGHSDLNGYGDAMQLMLKEHYLFVGHVDGIAGTTILDVSDPTQPVVVNQILCPPNIHSHKVQISGDLLLVNYEHYPRRAAAADRVGFQILDISDPIEPREIGFFDTGGQGVHRLWYTGGETVYLSAQPEGYRERIMMIVDIADPSRPREISRWWYPGMWEGDEVGPPWKSGDQAWGVHHPVVQGDRADCGCGGGGLLILDITELREPKIVSHTPWRPGEGGSSHTALPLPDRDLLIVADESTAHHCQEAPRRVRVFDIVDEKKPRLLSMFPEPEGDFCDRGGRFGPHNLHENRPGSFISDQTIFVAYFNAGLRVVDISRADDPREIAYYLPPTPSGQAVMQTNDLFVAENGLIYISDRVGGGVDILEQV